eukprot:TRINITY_DN16144_c0_g1_i2.p1 TRINITY_DN16144_c0_g1~~TRINITY_DN16144_c0_g1_i2.p1  ORF type:complete len:547 (+),score=43.47 TRINITY_DN16144_c0_g1_i2:27-1643(+)
MAETHFVLAVCSIVALVCVLLPLLGSPACFQKGYTISTRSYILTGAHGDHETYPPIGSHFANGIRLGVSLYFVIDPTHRFRSQSESHRIVRRYMAYAFAEAVLFLGRPWVFYSCALSDTLLWCISALAHLAEALQGWSMVNLNIERLRLLSIDEMSPVIVIIAKCARLITASGCVALVIIPFIPFGFSYAPVYAFVTAGVFGSLTYVNISLIAVIWNRIKEAVEDDRVSSKAKLVQVTTLPVVASAATSIGWGLTLAVPCPLHLHHWLYEIVYFLDRFANLGMVLVCVDAFGKKKALVLEFAHVGSWLLERRKEKLLETLLEAARAASGPSLMLAALLGKADPDHLLVSAMERFRCISWDVLKEHREIIVEGGTLNVVGPGSADLYRLSKPCKFGECDCFWSHSWRDDGTLKWDTMSRWCDDFRQQNGRAPVLWLDKTCIDQSSIEEDLECLPIFLAACNALVVTCGVNYSSRLWCILELFVYVRLLVEGDSRRAPVVLPLCKTDDEVAEIHQAWDVFDAASCECFIAEDKVQPPQTL